MSGPHLANPFPSTSVGRNSKNTWTQHTHCTFNSHKAHILCMFICQLLANRPPNVDSVRASEIDAIRFLLVTMKSLSLPTASLCHSQHSQIAIETPIGHFFFFFMFLSLCLCHTHSHWPSGTDRTQTPFVAIVIIACASAMNWTHSSRMVLHFPAMSLHKLWRDFLRL